MSELATYIRNATAAGTEVASMNVGELAGKIEDLARGAGVTTALLAGFEAQTEIRSAIELGLQNAGVRLVGTEEAPIADLGITHCETLVADTGSLPHTSNAAGTLTASLLPKIHLVVGRAVNVHPNLKSHLATLVGAMPSRLTLITGPSRTGDIEATMTKCVHGPGRVIHYLID